MSAFVWVDPNHPKTRYLTSVFNDPNAPAGYVLTNTSDGSAQIADGVHDQNLQVFVGGVNSGGYPAYQGSVPADPKYPNGVLF